MTDLLIDAPDLIDLSNSALDPRRPDFIQRFAIPGNIVAPLRFSAEVRTEGVTGPQGQDAMIFFNVEYDRGAIFWDTFLYPDTGTTPWRLLSCEARARDPLRVIELHIRFHARGRLLMRNLRVEAIAPWKDDADAVVAIFGDSTDMTCYLPTEHRLPRRLEFLLRDRFIDHRIDVHCFAEGGEFVKRLLESGRLERELNVLPRCDVAMIRFGLNDANKVTPEEFSTQLHTACDTIHRRYPNAKIVLSTTIPPLGETLNPTTLSVAAKRNLPVIRIDELFRERSAAGDSDWHHQPLSRIGRHRRDHGAGLTGDMHPNAWGAQMIAERYFEELEPMLAAQLK